VGTWFNFSVGILRLQTHPTLRVLLRSPSFSDRRGDEAGTGRRTTGRGRAAGAEEGAGLEYTNQTPGCDVAVLNVEGLTAIRRWKDEKRAA
jgi:hypothetical protein